MVYGLDSLNAGGGDVLVDDWEMVEELSVHFLTLFTDECILYTKGDETYEDGMGAG